MMARNAKATKIFMDPIISPAQARFGWRFWLLTLAALVAMAVTATLGAWQLSRAAQKQALQAMLVAREQMPVLVGRDLERAVATLPPRARAVLVLHDVEGWKHEEIATELGMAVGSSKAQLHRARGLLRTRIGEAA